MKKAKSFVPAAAMLVLLLVGSWILRPVDAELPDLGISFTEVAQEAHCLNNHSKVELDTRFNNIMPWLSSVGAAVATGDFDGDGFVDYYATNCGRNSQNRLFRNLGNGAFEDVAAAWGVADQNRTGASMDAIFLDYDNDGDQDLYLVKWAATNVLFENVGGRFEDRTEAAGVGYWGYANSVVSFDYDRDGLPDILVGNYFAEKIADENSGQMVRNDLWDPVTSKVMHSTFTHATNGGRNVLYKNLGNGSFRDVTYDVGIGHTGWTLDIGVGDLNNDGWTDLYVSNDFGADEIYFNTGAEQQEPAFMMHIDPDGHPGAGNDWWKGMNCDIGDVNNDGRQDVYVTNILAHRYKTDEGNMLWLNTADAEMDGGVKFLNIGEDVAVHDGGWGWGGRFCDVNNDGLMDVFALNGFATGKDRDNTYWFALQEMVTQTKNNASDTEVWPDMGDRDLSGYEPSRLFIQQASDADMPKFYEYAVPAGITDILNGRGIGLADYDNDGDLDFYVANQGAVNCLYRNETGNKSGAWLGLQLVGRPDAPNHVGGRTFATTHDADGVRVEVWAAGQYFVNEQNEVNGFAGQGDKRLHFGLGQAAEIDRMVINWPSGRTTTLEGDQAPTINAYHVIEESI